MKANTCGGCGSANLETTNGDDTQWAFCNHCLRLQELETRVDPLAQLCDNCACRPGSPERADPFGWMRWQEKHIEGGVPFYCHKGLALSFDPSGEMHVEVTAESSLEAQEKPCAGWLARRMAYLAKQETA